METLASQSVPWLPYLRWHSVQLLGSATAPGLHWAPSAAETDWAEQACWGCLMDPPSLSYPTARLFALRTYLARQTHLLDPQSAQSPSLTPALQEHV